MLLFSSFLSKENACLTPESLHWVLKNAFNVFGADVIANSKLQVSHPLMMEESTYDELPNEVLATFVMEPYFPRKHFNRVFAWLFGKESIEQIDAKSFRYHEQLKDQYKCYSLMSYWHRLPFTQDEYAHLYGEFSKMCGKNQSHYFDECYRGLSSHALVTPEMYLENEEKGLRYSMWSTHACSGIADLMFDERFSESAGGLKYLDSKLQAGHLIHEMERILRFKNLSRGKRDLVAAKFSLERFGADGVAKIYNHHIPDDVFDKMLNLGMISKDGLKSQASILKDSRITPALAEEIVLSSPALYSPAYFRRDDINAEQRRAVLSALASVAMGEKQEAAEGALKSIGALLTNGLLTLPEIELIAGQHNGMGNGLFSGNATGPGFVLFADDREDMATNLFVWSKTTGIALPPAIQDKWTEEGFSSNDQLHLYHDISTLIGSIKARLGINDAPPFAKQIQGLTLSQALYNERWSWPDMLALLEGCKQDVPNIDALENMKTFRQYTWRKLFRESFYPSLEREDLTGPHGRAEKLLAHLLDGDAHMLDEFDINLIIHSRLQLDYADDEVSLAASLAKHPEINERIVAERLKLRMEHINDTPTLAPASLRRAL